MLWMVGEIQFGGARQSPLLGGVHGSEWRHPGVGAAVAHFREHQLFAVQHHEVDLAGAALVVSRQHLATATAQQAFGAPFGAASRPRRGRGVSLAAPRPRPPPAARAPHQVGNGTKRSPTAFAHANSRYTRPLSVSVSTPVLPAMDSPWVVSRAS